MNLQKILSLAFRELTQQTSRLVLYSLSISVGIAALFATGSLRNDLLNQIEGETRELIGGDLVIKGFSVLPDSVSEQIEEDVIAAASERSFASMAVFTKSDNSRLVNVRAVSNNYPLIGEIEDELGHTSQMLSSGMARASVAKSLALQYKVEIGDSLRLGNQVFLIDAVHTKAPGQTGIAATVAPTIFIAKDQLEATQLVRVGSRIRNSYYYLTQKEINTGELRDDLNARLDGSGLNVEDIAAGKKRLGRAYSNLFRFLNLAAFVALVLGGIGVGSAIDLFLAQKKKMVAVLKCLGFEFRQIAWLFLFQVVFIGLAGSVFGILFGLLIQQVMPEVFESIFIQRIETTTHFDMVFLSLGLGVFISVLFGLKTLIPLLRSTPMAALRVELSKQKSFSKTVLIIRLVQFLVLVGITWIFARDWLLSLSFSLALLVLIAVLTGAAMGLRYLARKYLKSTGSFEWKYAVNALYRPQNQTVLIASTIGLSLVLVLQLFMIRSSLVETVSINDNGNRPNLIIFDIDETDVNPLEEFLKTEGAKTFDPMAIVPMRMHSLKGKNVFQWKKDSTHQIPSHVFDREYRVTERGSLGENETLLQGEWPATIRGQVVPISIEENYSNQSGLKLGDRVVFNVFGSLMEAEVVAIRQVDFTQMRESFTIVFPEGSLEGAPVMYAVMAQAESGQRMAEIQNKLVSNFRNISVVDLDLIFESLADVTSKIELAIQFMFSFSALTALVVLLNSLFLSKYQRLRENAALRTLGAISFNLTRINVYEFLIFGLLSILTGLLLSLLISWVLMELLFKVEFALDAAGIGWISLLTFVLVLFMGAINSRSLIRVSPMRILKGAN